MKRAISGILLALFVISVLFPELSVSPIALIDATEEHITPYFSDNTGTYFEVNNSERLNVTITSTATVRIVLAVPFEMIDYIVESADGATSTTLTLGNLPPSTTYYMYQDGYFDEVAFTTDSDGSYTYTQDLAQSHRVFIQPTLGTTYIYEDTTLTADIIGSVALGADDIVLDLNGYSIISTGPGIGIGIVIGGKTGVTVKNGIVDGFYEGIYIGSSNLIDSVTIRNCFFGILFPGSYNTVRYSTIENCISHGIGWMGGSTGNEIYGNTLSDNLSGGIFLLFSSGGNKIVHNNFFDNYPTQAESWMPYGEEVWDDGYPSGGNYWCDGGSVDICGGPSQNVAGSDGICDTPYFIYEVGADNYPLLSPWTPDSSTEQTEVVKGSQTYPIQLVSTSTITNIVPTMNTLHFDVSGQEGASAYVSAVLPIGLNTTTMKVFVNNQKLTPPPYPVITENNTHYFVYFTLEFASTSEVDILFDPITATYDQEQDTLNLRAMGKYVTVYVELPEDYDVYNIDPFTIILNSTVAVDTTAPTEIGDYDKDGILDLMIKFDRAEAIAYALAEVDILLLFEEGFITATWTITGELTDGTPFQGNDTTKLVWQGPFRFAE